MMMSLVQYWSLTNDSTYNDQVKEAIIWQSGPNGDFMVENQTLSEGNDDQAFWGMTAMTAAELNFPNPPQNSFQYLSLAQGVFNVQLGRWNAPPAACNGGLRWQIFTFNNGWNYKNTISNGCLFSIAARLARYTGNMTYAEQAENVWNWIEGVGLFDEKYAVWDGTNALDNCTQKTQNEWIYNSAILLHGAANMWNISTSQADKSKWQTRVDGLLNRTYDVFFDNQVMTDAECEVPNNCDLDMTFFKGFGVQWMVMTGQLCPWTFNKTMGYVKASAQAAAQQCSGPNSACGLKWTSKNNYDGTTGVGTQMSAMCAFANLLAKAEVVPVTQHTGGTSVGNNTAPPPPPGGQGPPPLQPVTVGDEAGAAILTIALSIFVVGGSIWVAL